jgi:hypothetical protein
MIAGRPVGQDAARILTGWKVVVIHMLERAIRDD